MARSVKTAEAALSRTAKPIAADSLKNLVSGMGTPDDKRFHNHYGFSRIITRVELENMYRDSWLARRIVDSVAEDMTREWLTCSFDDPTSKARDAIETLEKRFNIQNKFSEAIKWARLYGGSVIVIGIGNDDLSKPLDITTIKKDSLKYLHVLDRWRVSAASELVLDLSSPNFSKPLSYLVAESAVQVHHTRILRFDGAKLPYFQWQANARWDDSELQGPFQAVSDLDAVTASIGTMMFEANVDVITSEELAAALSTDEGTARVKERYRQTSLMKSMIRTLLLDGTEKYEKKSNSFANLDKILDKFMLTVSGAADIPATRLFGMSPAGMSSTGDNDQRNYEGRIAAAQESRIRHPAEYLYEIMVRSALGRLPDNFAIEFNSLREMDGAQQATIDYQRAQTDQIYLNAAVVTEGIVARELKERGVYPNMTDDEIEMIEDLANAPPMPGKPQPGAAPNDPGLPAPGDPNVVPKIGAVAPKNETGTMQIPSPDEGDSKNAE